MAIEEDAQAIRARELVKQFKLEMGVDTGETTSPKIDLPEREVEQGEKTVGRQRTQTD
jgi:hypothetical protein